MPPTKKQKREHAVDPENSAAGSSRASSSALSDYQGNLGDSSDPEDSGEEAPSSPNTDDEIAGSRIKKSKKTLKRKHRATDATKFASTLQSLLSTEAPSTQPLSLKPSIARKRNDEKLEAKGKKVLLGERKEKEEKGRIKDVIGGWGGESERALRKVAQRGVIKLFNVIQQAQAASTAAEESLKARRGSGKPTLPAPSLAKTKQKGKQKSNSLGRPNDGLVGEDDFLNSIRSGEIVAKA